MLVARVASLVKLSKVVQNENPERCVKRGQLLLVEGLPHFLNWTDLEIHAN